MVDADFWDMQGSEEALEVLSRHVPQKQNRFRHVFRDS